MKTKKRVINRNILIIILIVSGNVHVLGQPSMLDSSQSCQLFSFIVDTLNNADDGSVNYIGADSTVTYLDELEIYSPVDITSDKSKDVDVIQKASIFVREFNRIKICDKTLVSLITSAEREVIVLFSSPVVFLEEGVTVVFYALMHEKNIIQRSVALVVKCHKNELFSLKKEYHF